MKLLLDEVAEQMKRTIEPMDSDQEITLKLSRWQGEDLVNFIQRNVFYRNIGEAVTVQLVFQQLINDLEKFSESAADS